MNKEEEKQLLLKDICARLQYGVFVEENVEKLDKEPVIYTYDYHPFIDNCKPYLRPMSSMTNDEYEKLKSLSSGLVIRKDILHDIVLGVMYIPDAIDWLISNQFDYRGLIEMGLALPAKDYMYKIPNT